MMVGNSLFKIVLADDHVLIRHGIRNMISQNEDLLVIGEVSNGEELLDFLADEEADLIILDISMPKIGGLEALALVRAKYPWMKILVLSMHKSKQYFYHAMTAGADGYLAKDDSEEELLIAIRKIQAGKTYLSPFFTDEFAEEAISIYRREKKSPFQELTKREKEILQLVVDGHTSKEMADTLGLSHRTVDHHRSNLLRKFRLKNSVDLVNFAVKNGFVAPGKY